MGSKTKQFRTDQVLDAMGLHKPFSITIKGESMLPKIQPGDQLEVIKSQWARIRPGDVVAVPGSEGIVVHRLLCKTPKTIRLAGDANRKWDSPVSNQYPVYRVLSLMRNGEPLPLPHSRMQGVWRLARQVCRAAKARLI